MSATAITINYDTNPGKYVLPKPVSIIWLRPIRNIHRLVRRNETCPFCTSGKKFKKCCAAGSRRAYR